MQDWGDIAPENGTHQQMNQLNHPAISLYDNAMLIIAMESFASLAALVGEAAIAVRWKTAASAQRSATIQHMWDRSRRKFRNHIYVVKPHRSFGCSLLPLGSASTSQNFISVELIWSASFCAPASF